MKTFVAIAALACVAGLAAAQGPTPVPFKSCASGTDPVTVKSITVTGTLSPGQTVVVNATGSSTAAITGGTFELDIKFLGITVIKQTGDLCTSSEFSLHCPVAAGGAAVGGGSIAIPSAAPHGAYVLQLTGKDTAGAELFCENINVNIGDAMELEAPAMHPEVIKAVNKAGAGWTAGVNPRFEGAQLKHVARMCGTTQSPDGTFGASALPVKSTEDMLPASAIPASFDARTAWPKCPIIAHIRDQADCGSCWAFGSTEAFNDRMCIRTNGSFTTELSAGDTTACCALWEGTCMSMGCNGGQPSGAWSYFTSHGIVSGGDYDTMNTGKSCMPYSIPNCGHHEPSPFKNCTEPMANTPSCPKQTCTDSKYSGTWAGDLTKAKTSYSLGSVQQAQSDIMTYGSITGAFTVYADFPTYRSGVYKHVTGSALGGHAIKLLGWGTENGADYWLVANSWNKYWGDKGFFKIARGTNECGIESGLVAGHV